MAKKRFPISLRDVEVVRIAEVSPRMRRITLGGPQMGAFTSANGFAIPPFASEGPDDHIKIFLPEPQTGVLTLSTQADGHLDWPHEPAPLSREYTPRVFDPATGTCDIEFVLHGHGIASTWAAKAQLGDRIFIAGPKASMLVLDANWFWLIGDETALPAIANWLRLLPPDTPVQAIILIEDDSARIALPERAKVRVQWRRHDPNVSTTMRDAVAELPLPDGSGFVWAAGEREAIRLLRTHLIEGRRLDKRQLDLSAYWHLGSEDDDSAAYRRLRALADLAMPMALRAAATFDLAGHVDRGADDVAALAMASNCSPEVLAGLVPLLVDAGVLTHGHSGLGVGSLGRILVEDEHEREHLDAHAAPGRRNLSWTGLLSALVGGDAYAHVHGQDYWRDSMMPSLAAGFAEEHGHLLEDLAEDAAKLVPLAAGAQVVELGGIGTFLLELIERQPTATGTLVTLPELVSTAQAIFADSVHAARLSVSSETTLPRGGGAYLLPSDLSLRSEAVATAALREVAAAMDEASRCYVLEPGAGNDPAWTLELRLAQGAPRAHDAISVLARETDLALVRSWPLPEGATLLEFTIRSWKCCR